MILRDGRYQPTSETFTPNSDKCVSGDNFPVIPLKAFDIVCHSAQHFSAWIPPPPSPIC